MEQKTELSGDDLAETEEVLKTSTSIWNEMLRKGDTPVQFTLPLTEIRSLDASFDKTTISFSPKLFFKTGFATFFTYFFYSFLG